MKQTLLLAVLVSTFFSAVFGQENQGFLAIDFKSDGPRVSLNLQNEWTEVRLCNLSPQQTYYLRAAPYGLEDTCAFLIGTDKTALSDEFMFVADGDCQTLYFKRTCPQSIQAYLSMECTSCKKATPQSVLRQGVIVTVFNGDLLSLIQNNFIGGNCFDISNVTFSGGPQQLGTFTNGSSFGLDNGIILSSGSVLHAQGPNNSGGASGSDSQGGGSDPDLETLTSQPLNDAAVLQFDFMPTTPQVQFDYVFGSEEYCEWVNSAFNDVFGFFISGPGITGTQNIAVVPGTTTPITINTVNNGSNSTYFVPNSASCGSGVTNNNIQYDGYTTVLTAVATVPDTNCTNYHLKLAIADGTDDIFDSGVFLRRGSFNAGSQSYTEAIDAITGTDVTTEGCGNARFKFCRLDIDSKEDLILNFTVGGTATPGVDYQAITQTQVTVPKGQLCDSIPITVFPDGIPEGIETIELTILNNECSCNYPVITLNIQDPPEIQLQTFDTVLCASTSSAITLDPQPTGTSPFGFLWSDNSSNPTLTVPVTNTSETYTVTVTDACGATKEGSWTVSAAPEPTANLFGDAVICPGGMTDIFLSLTGSNPPWDVEIYKDGVFWNSFTFFNSNEQITVTEPGVYTINTVSDQGCPGTATGSATVTVGALQATALVFDEQCAGASDGSIEVTPSGIAPYSFNWSPAQPDNNIITGLAPGTYTVTITDAGGCTTVESYTVNAALPLIVNPVVIGTDCTDPNGGSVDLNVSGGAAPYSFNWDNGATDQNLFGLSAGTYLYTVTDANNCSVQGSVDITESVPSPVANVEPAGTIDCNNPTITLSGNGSSTGAGITYQWTTTNGHILSGSTSLSPVVDAAGTYMLVVTNSLGCTKDTSITVSADLAQPVADVVSPANIDCNNSSITFVDNGSSTGPEFTYNWTTSDGNIVSGNTSLTPTVDAQGTYTLVITNTNNGCTSTMDVVVTGDTQMPTAVATAEGDINCNNTQVSLDGSGSSSGPDFTYQWTTTNGHIAAGATSINPVVDAAGTYQLIVTDNNNGCIAIATVTVSENLSTPTVDAGPPATLGCTQTEVILTGTVTPANAAVQWTTANGSFVSGQGTLTPVVNAAGDYTLTATDPVSGCTAESTVTVTTDQGVPVADAGAPADLTCAVTTVTLDGSGSSQGGNYSYQWTTADGNIQSGATGLNPVVDAAGTYELVVTDNTNGCTALSTVTIGENMQAPVADAGAAATVDCQTPQVTLGAINPAGDPNLSYTWTTTDGNIVSGADTEHPIVDAGGTYTLVVSNTANGCTASDQVTVIENIEYPTLYLTGDNEITCTVPLATIEVSALGTGSLTFDWTTADGNIVSGNGTNTIMVDQAGTYSVTVLNTDNGCSTTDDFTLTTNAMLPTAVATVQSMLTCVTDTVSISGLGSSTGPDFVFSWTTPDGNIVSPANQLDILVNAPGTYTLGVTNVTNNCASSFSIQVNEDITPPTVDAGAPQTLLCGVDNIQLAGTASNLSGNIQFLWTTQTGNIVAGANTPTPTVNAAGTYYLTAVNENNGCSASDSVVVNQDVNTPTVDAGPDVSINCQNVSVVLGTSNTSSGPEFTYQWTATNGGSLPASTTDPFITVTSGGTYQLEVTNTTNGCTAISVVNVAEDTQLPQVDPGISPVLNCLVDTAIVGGANTSVGNEFVYQWTTTNGNILSGADMPQAVVNAPGDYSLHVTNNTNFCENEVTVTVIENKQFPTVSVAAPEVITCTQPVVFVSGNGSSTGAAFTYQWTTASGNIVSGATTLTPQVNQPGFYVLTVLNNQNGCTAKDSVEVQKDNSQPTALVMPAPDLTCSVSQVTLDGSASSSGSEFIYQWTTANGNIVQGDTTLQPVIDQPGDYHLVVTNTTNNCQSFADVTVMEDTQPPVVEAGANMTLGCQVDTLNLDASSGTDTGADFKYEWTTSDGHIVAGANTLTPGIDQVGTYTLTVTNLQNGCSASDDVVVVPDINAPVVVMAPPGAITCANATIDIDAGASSSGPEFDYEWSTTDGNIVNGIYGPVLTVNQPGTYTLTIVNSTNGCATSKSVAIDENTQAPAIDGNVLGAISCIDSIAEIQIAASGSGGALDYAWATSDGSIVSGTNTSDLLVNSGGTYVVSVTDLNNGCMGEMSFVVSEDKVPPALSVADPADITCKSPTTTLHAQSGQGFVYEWIALAGNIVSGLATADAVVDTAGDYRVTVTNPLNGCTASATVSVQANVTPPVADAGSDASLPCDGGSIQLGVPPDPGLLYSWSTNNGSILSGAKTSQPTVGEAGEYRLTVEDKINGCTATAQVSVSRPEPIADLSLDIGRASCAGTGGSIVVTDVIGGTPPYLYSFDNGATFSPAYQQQNLHAGSHYVIIKDANGCEFATQAYVPQADAPEANAEPTVFIELGDSARLEVFTSIPPGDIDTIIWTPVEGLSCADCLDPIAKPVSTTYYEVQIIDNNACEAVSRLAVYVKDPDVYIPNAFSPNSNNLQNSAFYVFALSDRVKEIVSMRVFDRWGNLVFSNTHFAPNLPDQGWDGTFRGQPMEPAVFVYHVVVELISGETKQYKGDVTIVR